MMCLNEYPVYKHCKGCTHKWAHNWDPPPVGDTAAGTTGGGEGEGERGGETVRERGERRRRGEEGN